MNKQTEWLAYRAILGAIFLAAVLDVLGVLA